jgi:hypothetical protein
MFTFFLGTIQFGREENIIIYLDAKRNESGHFQFKDIRNVTTPITDQYLFNSKS